MRLHHLSATAFGPFAETVTVDFDELSAAGLFLLSGPTGAGKTSVLDAVAFALYGDVPGDRSTARSLRSDHAAPGVAPRVVLQATMAGRRFRITRSPQWTRPKKRGTGTTTEQAHVVIEERVDDEWSPLSNRIDETGHLITGLLGMNMTQFCQVAMLPQGEFQAFLRASSLERHKLLQQLFSTRRFQDIEQWVRDHARQLGRDAAEAERDVARAIDRIVEASDTPLPAEWEADQLGTLADDGALGDWVSSQVEAAANGAEAAESEVARTATALDRVSQAASEGQRVTALQQRGREAQAESSRLAAESADQQVRRDRLALAHRSAPMEPLHRHARSARASAERAAQEAATAWQQAAAALGDSDPDRDTVLAGARAARDRAAVATALRPREPELARLHDQVRDGREQATRLEADLGRRRQQVAELPARVTQLEGDLGPVRRQGDQVDEFERTLAGVAERIDAAERLVEVRAAAERARTHRDEVVEQCLALKEDWLEVREQRIAGIAAELAHDLAVGGSCPVCGSADHPHKAEATPGAPSAATEKAARKRLDDAELTRTAAEAALHESSLTLAALEQQVDGVPLEDLTTEQAEVTAQLTAARAAVQRGHELETELARARADLERARTEQAALEVELATTRAATDADAAAAERLRAEIDDVRGNHADLAALVAAETTLADTCEAAVRTRDRASQAAQVADDADQALTDWLSAHDFDDVDQALEALLTEAGTRALQEAIDAHDRSLERVAVVLDDPEVSAALALDTPDLTALEAAVAQARGEQERARGAATLAQRRKERLTALDEELTAALARWAPLRADHLVAAELAAFVEGKSAENELRMRLSAYVLAWRLGQVVAAANERLVRMSDGRYTLEHSDRRGGGEARGGLSLRVLDEWSGESRDPVTLSGGETFVVSLALALGLADVVTREVGGAELDTLFVDEGFGSLDADTLDDVMDTLDSLREGGRVVGVVSHVSEMRSRIPTRLAVTKDRTGSTLAIVHAQG
ncbi:SMC family ATPase [Nocardioides sp. AE5]|uniref:SMC family ATPase n=1 Tax=Nocardioides sp. AE5 TaxID=2962573 RepID=UPI002882CBB3|nr:SMC family ATPase [Nocardioides sp. AE5]MDT0201443.1 SMC family ATPase [Nocardioides sp. AE5]